MPNKTRNSHQKTKPKTFGGSYTRPALAPAQIPDEVLAIHQLLTNMFM
jgi:hypothetical protein